MACRSDLRERSSGSGPRDRRADRGGRSASPRGGVGSRHRRRAGPSPARDPSGAGGRSGPHRHGPIAMAPCRGSHAVAPSPWPHALAENPDRCRLRHLQAPRSAEIGRHDRSILRSGRRLRSDGPDRHPLGEPEGAVEAVGAPGRLRAPGRRLLASRDEPARQRPIGKNPGERWRPSAPAMARSHAESSPTDPISGRIGLKFRVVQNASRFSSASMTSSTCGRIARSRVGS
jgi:hypothetical protein